jgi:methylamine---glutamate N-methyltransferase subunit C
MPDTRYPLKVPDTPENRNECLCPDCPSYPHTCGGENLYCSVGFSACNIGAKGCLCPGCSVYERYSLGKIYFCNTERGGTPEILMRKMQNHESTAFYQSVHDIKTVAFDGKSIVSSMGSRKILPFSFNDLHLLPAQVHRIPKNKEELVDTRMVIGPSSKKPLISNTPVIVSGLSYGAVSKNVRLIISRTSGLGGFLFNSGEGGVLPEELEAKQNLIVQYSTGRFGISEDLLREAGGVEIRFGQGAYPGKGSFLPAAKMSEDVARIRGLMKGEDAYSPAHHPDIAGSEDLRKKIEWLRSVTGGVPIGAKIGCGAIERDISVLVKAGVDFIAIDGFGGGTGATNDYVRENVGIPLIAALPRAARQLRKLDAQKRVSLIAGGNLRTSADFVKCLALGADGVYIGTAALIAINCEQYRICHTGLCPTGVTTQIPDLVAQCTIDEGVRRLGNYIRVMTEEIANFARITGKDNIHDLDSMDLVSFNRDLATIAGCPWIGDPAAED